MNKENPTIIVFDPDGTVATLAEGVMWDRPSRKIKVRPPKPAPPPVEPPPPEPPPEPPPPPPPVEPPPPVVTEPPIVVDPTAPPPPTAVHRPRTSEELQNAINIARPGEAIHLDPAVRYVGNFNFPGKENVVRLCTDNLNPWSIPGTRIRASDLPRMATIQTPNSAAALMFGVNADNWGLCGLRAMASPTQHTYQVIQIGDLERHRTREELPDNISIDRCLVEGDPVLGGRRGMLAMGTRITVRDCLIESFFSGYADSQAILITNGSGPFLIENNFLEGAGENLFLSNEAENPDLKANGIAENIVIRRNHLKKRLEWMQGLATGLVIKNLFEIKAARNVLIEGNVLENNPQSGQQGYGVLFTARTGDVPEISGVQFRNNKIINSVNGITVLGRNGEGEADPGRVFDLTIENNLIEGSIGRAFLFVNGIENVAVRRNTALNVGASIWLSDGPVSGRIDFTGNVIGRGEYGIHHSGTGEGTRSIVAFWREWDVAGNVFVGPGPDHTPSMYPPGNTFVLTASEVPAGAGADMAALNAAIAGVVQ